MADVPKSSRDFVQESTEAASGAIDFDFLAAQTFCDAALEREVLELFLGQAERIMPLFPTLEPGRQADTAHLLKGSARGIGAWRVAAAAERYEAAAPEARHLLLPDLKAAVAAADEAIRTYLAKPND